MKHSSQFPVLFLAALSGLGLAGCLNLKPAQTTSRYFVLSPMQAPVAASTPAVGPRPSVGLGPVRIPAYLFRTSLAVRRSPTEVGYLENSLWAERLDAGCQRVLAANLSTLLPTDHVRLSAWRREDVACEVQVTLEQFEVDADGRGTLAAQWRVLSPGGSVTLKAAESHLSKPGPAPATNPQAAVATLSELLADLSRELSDAVNASQFRPK